MWEIEDDLFSSDHGVGDIFSRNERYPPETYIADSMMGPIQGTFPDEEVDEFKEGMPSLHYTGPPDLHIDPLDVEDLEGQFTHMPDLFKRFWLTPKSKQTYKTNP
ncbi:hypothetical protein BWQ96_08384 [Gracilariopsis chorda]|uniref:Uncharacterized protein n=1 Tax=Gracilariopsis chorda TaxID=448386 RepID=A0A2V3III5_9FLOR|nr:hypothetical protein BWQ96_08384 [Gracilariopsis chorda]|eukprot:PXF41882.1 hypothetical protein BWQ96_08384 [Gracilariopsis chorda]